MRQLTINNIVMIFIFMSLPGRLSAGGTVVGNGGDPVFEFLEAARTSVIETLKIIANEPGEQANFCKQPSLQPDQIQFCRDYFLKVLPEILRLSQGLKKIPFVLREHPLFVKGPDGQPMIVSARTQLGPQGPIEFHRDSVKTMLPTQVVFLITHEFQHKADFNGRNLGDNDPIGPFASERDLLDSAAQSVVAVARRKGKVGNGFGIRDIFDCMAQTGDSQFGARLSSSRFFQDENLMSYESSIGKNPTDGLIYLPISHNQNLVLKMQITEPNNCGDPHPLRRNLIQIIERSKSSDGLIQDVIASELNQLRIQYVLKLIRKSRFRGDILNSVVSILVRRERPHRAFHSVKS